MPQTVNISVTLDTAGNPAVGLSNRNQNATNGDTIKWLRAGGYTFDITELDPNSAPFSDIKTGGSGQWLSAVFSASTSGDHPYTLTVRQGGTDYTTTEESGNPDDGRPVIRN